MKNPGNYIFLLALFLLPLLFYPAVNASLWKSSSDVHAMLEFTCALLAITAGIMVIIHFLTSGNSLFLIISCGLILIGSEELFHGLFSFEKTGITTQTTYESRIITTWLGGNMILLLSFLIALLFNKREIRISGRRLYAVWVNTTSFIVAAIVVFLIFNSPYLTYIVTIGSNSKEYTELSISFFFLVAAIILIWSYKESIFSSPLLKNLAAFLIIRALVNIYSSSSDTFYDLSWDIAHLLALISYFFPIFGVWAEMLRIHRYSQVKINELAKETKEHRLTINALKESEEKLKHIFSNISDVIYSVDMVSKEFNYLGPSFTTITGYTMEDIEKMGGRASFLRKVVDSATFSEWENFLTGLDNEQPLKDFNFETYWHCKDGTIKCLSDHWIPIFVNGNLDSTYGILSDITERKLSEQILSKQNTALSKINRFAIRLSDLSFDHLLEEFITRQAKEISGAKLAIFSRYDSVGRSLVIKHIETESGLGEKIGTLLADNHHGLSVGMDDERYQSLRNGNILRWDTLSEASGGEISPATGEKIQLLLDADRFIGLVYVIHGYIYGTTILAMPSGIPDPEEEILENFDNFAAAALQQKRSEKITSDSEKKFRTLFEKASDGIYMLNMKRDFALINESFARMHGYTLEELNNIKLLDLETPETNSLSGERIKRVLSGEPLLFEVKHFNKTGNIITLEAAASLINLGEEKFIIALHRDITDRLQAQQELNERMAELTRLNGELEKYIYANQELKQFTYLASHQLQEPIRTVLNFSKIIEEDYSETLGNDGIKHLHIIREASKRMARLMDTLLDYSQLGRIKILDYTDTGKLLEAVIEDLDKQIEESGAKIEMNNLPSLFVYEVEFRQLLLNLISNSIKFRRKDVAPIISVKASMSDDKWLFEVADNGIGIDTDHYEKIFDLFKRLHHNEDEFKGHGIGLAYCKKIVQFHQGEIWVESEQGKGSTFRFTIPAL